MARLYQRSLENAPARQRQRWLKAAETFFLETLSPFEATHRGFRETNVRLAQLVKTLENRTSDLAALSNQVLHAQEEERKRISRELHDEVAQSLAAISVHLARMKKDVSSQKFKSRVGSVQNLLSETMVAVHDFALELRPPMLDELGLLPALRSMLKSFSERTGLRMDFHGSLAAEKLTGAQKTVLFRVAQESLAHVAHHAKATHVTVAIRKTKSGICMTIADNGRSSGYHQGGSGTTQERLGLLGIRERMRLISGRYNILARPNKGTTIRVTVPLPTS